MIVNVNQYAPTKENHRFDPSDLDFKKGLTKTTSYVQDFDGVAAVNEIFADQPGFVKTTPDNRAEAEAHYKSSNGLDAVKRKGSKTHSHAQPDLVYMPDRPLVMEYTPNYLVHDETPLLIHKAFHHTAEHLKFIMIVREPVKRMISSWRFKMEKTPGGITTFKEAVVSGLAQAKCIEDCFDKYFLSGDRWRELVPEVLSRGDFLSSNISLSFMRSHCSIKVCRVKNDPNSHGYNGGNSVMAHVVKGMYMYELLAWLRVFRLEQFLIISLEEYVETPMGTMKKIIDFLGLQMFHEDPFGPKRADGMNLTYAYAASKMKMKDNPVHANIKASQQRMGRLGWDNEEELQEVLKIVLNQRPTDHGLDSQITPALTAQLKNAYKKGNKRLFKMLGWPDDYY
jgi:hypothetical protein